MNKIVVFRRFAFVAVAVFLAFPTLCSGRGLDVNKRQDVFVAQNLSTQLQNICDRQYSTTAVVGNKLFINGGRDLKDRNKSTLEYTEFGGIQYIDLSSSWNIESPPLTTTKKPTSLNANEGCGWSDGTYFYQYGGWRDTIAQESFGVWQYESSKDSWTVISVKSSNVERLASGGYTNAPRIKKSYAFGGFLDQATTSNPWYSRLGRLNDAPGRDDLIEFDWTTKTATNITYTNDTKRKLAMVDNSLIYVPAGKSGILLSFGGREALTSEAYQHMADLTEIKFYDIASNAWYYQRAEGAVNPVATPPFRVEPCTVMQAAADNSSYNIYMFGGSTGDEEESSRNDMWILSLPSFKWFKVSDPTGAPSDIPGGRTSHTCQIIGNRQMAIIGGGRSAEAHKQCLSASLFIFDMSTLSWSSGFDPIQTAYSLPALITDVIGGHGGGGANPTFNRPTLWDNNYTTKIFEHELEGSVTTGPSDAAKTKTASPGVSSRLPTAAIVGGVVGGIVVLAALGAIGMVYRKRRGRKTSAPPEEVQELSPEGAAHELQGPISYLPELQGTRVEDLDTVTGGK